MKSVFAVVKATLCPIDGELLCPAPNRPKRPQPLELEHLRLLLVRSTESTRLGKPPYMVENKRNDWKRLAKLAAAEEDPEKLLSLVAELNVALSERVQQIRGASPSAKLLFVDDEPSIRITLPPILQQRGFEVQAVGSVPEALQLIESRKFDVLLSDLNIGEPGDGFTVVREMRKAQPRCVTILLTGYPAFESAVEAIHHEVDDYVVKPADIDVLVNIMKEKLFARRFRLA